jgi:hypothetical protein
LKTIKTGLKPDQGIYSFTGEKGHILQIFLPEKSSSSFLEIWVKTAESVPFEAHEIILYHAFMHEISLRDLELYT